MDLILKDNYENVSTSFERVLDSWLEESAGELEAQVKRNTAVDTGQLKNSWEHKVHKGKKTALVGSALENAIWEEFGTGEYALEGKGRKGGWYIPIGSGQGQMSPEVAGKYHFRITKGKDGQLFAFTKGKKPRRALHRARRSIEPKLRGALEDKLRRMR